MESERERESDVDVGPRRWCYTWRSELRSRISQTCFGGPKRHRHRHYFMPMTDSYNSSLSLFLSLFSPCRQFNFLLYFHNSVKVTLVHPAGISSLVIINFLLYFLNSATLLLQLVSVYSFVITYAEKKTLRALSL